MSHFKTFSTMFMEVLIVIFAGVKLPPLIVSLGGNLSRLFLRPEKTGV